MGFILKLIFIYFLIKFLWSVSREKVVAKLIKFINKRINSQIKKQSEHYSNGNNERNDNNLKKNDNNTFDADYKIIK